MSTTTELGGGKSRAEYERPFDEKSLPDTTKQIELADGGIRVIDWFHGPADFRDPLDLAILRSRSFQKQREISQLGHRPGYLAALEVGPHTRFDHAIGVWLLLRRHGASREEQLAGAWHDTDHGTFSHCIDYLHQDTLHQTHHDDRLADAETPSEARQELATILAAHPEYGIEVENVLDLSRHPLQERPLPDLCADRIDYWRRDAVSGSRYGRTIITLPRAQEIIDGLTVSEIDGVPTWVLRTWEDAREMAETFSFLNENFYTGDRSVAVHRATTEWLRHAIAMAYINEEDLYHVDEAELLEHLQTFCASDAELDWLRRQMDDPFAPQLVLDNPRETAIRHKRRVINPHFMRDGQIVRLSDTDLDWRAEVERYVYDQQNGGAHKLLRY